MKLQCREERVRVFVTYADTTGYTTWAKRGATSYEDISLYNRRMYSEFRRYEAETGYSVKFLSDGFVSFAEMVRGNNSALALAVLRSAYKLWQRMDGIISQMEHPRLGGFRVRVPCGTVSKLWIPPINPKDRRWKTEYIGFSPALGDRISKIERSIPCITTVGVRQHLEPTETSVEFQDVCPTEPVPSGLDPQDMKELLSFKCELPSV